MGNLGIMLLFSQSYGLAGAAIGGSHLDILAAVQFARGEHRSPALRSAAVARAFFIVRVVEVVLVDELFAGGNVA